MIVCSAMGKTTNSLISAGDFALSGQVRDTVVWCDGMGWDGMGWDGMGGVVWYGMVWCYVVCAMLCYIRIRQQE
jgi:hypothetical protein